LISMLQPCLRSSLESDTTVLSLVCVRAEGLAGLGVTSRIAVKRTFANEALDRSTPICRP